MSPTLRYRVTFAAALAGVPVALGHAFWIQPSTFLPSPDSVVRIHLMVGVQFPGDPVARDPERLVEFNSYGPSGQQPVPGRDGMDPAGLARFNEPGLYTIAYRSNPASLTLKSATFETYLKEEGLEKVIEARAVAGESSAEVHEIYSRCSKSLLRVGDGATDGFDRTIGLPLELTALDNPCTAKPGDTLRFRIDDHGKPCEGLLIKAHHAMHPDESLSARSGADGIVALNLPYDGLWLVTAVQMTDAPEGSGAEWESMWASLTFQVGDATSTAGGRP